MSRIWKQIFYSSLYLFTLLVIISGIYFWFLKPAPSCFDNIQNQGEQGIDCGGPCAKVCLPVNLKPIETVNRIMIFRPTPTSVSLLAQLRNSNLDVAAKSFDYQFQLYDGQDNLIQSISGRSFIYGAEIKYLAALNLNFAGSNKLSRADLLISNPVWVKANQFSKPQLTVQNWQTSAVSNQLAVNGRLANNDSFTFPQVTILAVFYGQLGQAAGISQTELDNLASGESRAFSLFHPLLKGVDFSKTKLFINALRPS